MTCTPLPGANDPDAAKRMPGPLRMLTRRRERTTAKTVGVAVGVGVSVWVAVGGGVSVAVNVAVAVGIGEGVAVSLAVAVGGIGVMVGDKVAVDGSRASRLQAVSAIESASATTTIREMRMAVSRIALFAAAGKVTDSRWIERCSNLFAACSLVLHYRGGVRKRAKRLRSTLPC